MSEKITIVNNLTPAIVLTIEANIAAAKAISDNLFISMSASETKGLLKVGDKRNGEMGAIFTKLLKPFPQTVPGDYTIAAYEALQQELTDSLSMEALYTAEANAYKTHAEIVANNLFLMSIEGLDEGRHLMGSNPGIATVVDEISAEFFPRTAANGATVYSLAASIELQLANLVTGKRIVNDGTTIITVLVKGGGAASTLTIYPGDSAVLPAGWTNVTITNLSATTVGSVQVFIKVKK